MKLERLVAIIMLLLEREQVSGKELAEMFEVSLRTIYRDIESINAAGIPIHTKPGVHGGIGIMKAYKVRKGIFTSGDIHALLMGLGFISNTLSGEEIKSTFAKIQSFVPEERQREVEIKINQISIDLSSFMGGFCLQQKMELIKEALDKQKMLSFAYRGHNGKRSERTVEPYRLLFKGSYWYLQGFCLQKQDFRTFKLSRISSLKCEEANFIMRELPQAFSTFIENMSQRMNPIKLLVDGSILEQILDYCSEDRITPAENGKYFVDFDFIEDDYGYGLLMRFGDQCVCVEPKHVRDEMIRRSKKVMDVYQNTGW